MRIAFFVGAFPVVSETFILRQITGLIDQGHDVDIYAERRPEPDQPIHDEVLAYNLLARTTYVNEQLPADSGYWEMPVWPLSGRTWLPGAEKPIHNALRALRAVPTLARCLAAAPRVTVQALDPREYGYQARSLSTLYRLDLLRSRATRYDALHAHFGPAGNTFRFARSLWNAPLIVSFHGYDFTSLPRQQGHGIYRRLFETVDIVTANSGYTQRRLEELGCPARKIRRLHVGLDINEFPFHERVRRGAEPLRLLTVARLVEIKGLAYAIRAVARVRERHPELRYDIVGEGPLRPELEQLIRDLGIEAAVTLWGARQGECVRRMMAEAHLFLLASVSIDGDQEGQGLVLQEAQASGLPVVATEHGAFPEGIVPGRSGLLVPERDVDALAGALNGLIEHPECWPAMGRAGRRYVEERYEIGALNRQLVGIYAEARRLARWRA